MSEILTADQVKHYKAYGMHTHDVHVLADSHEALRARLAECEKERDRLAIMAREVTCVWCGHQFASDLQSQAQHLYDHAKVCEKHPVNAANKRISDLERQHAADQQRIAELTEVLKPFAMYAGTLQNDRDSLLIGYYQSSPTVRDCRRAKEATDGR